MEQTQIDIKEFHSDIKYFLIAAFPWATTIEYYERQAEKIEVPAIFFELDEITPDDPSDIGTEQFPCVLRFAAYVVLSYKKDGADSAKILAKIKALEVAAKINRQRFSNPVGPCNVLGIVRDDLTFSSDQYEAQRIEFTFTALAGSNLWDDIPPEITSGNAGFSPKVGPEFLSDYAEVFP